jgi:hypothetical protein
MRRLLGVFTALALIVGLGLPLPAQASPIRCLDAACMSMELTGDLIVDGTEHQLYGTNFGPRRLEGNGYQILVVNGGTLDWNGVIVTNVSRIMFTDGAGPSTLRNMTIEDSGRPQLGFYPLHWHLNYDTTRETLVQNVTVRDSLNRAFVPHGSHGITFLNDRAENVKGPGLWWDAPGTNTEGDPSWECRNGRDHFCTLDNSNDIIVDGMVVDGVTNTPGDNRGFLLAAYTLGAGSGNVIRNSEAHNVTPSHVKDCSGFDWPAKAAGNPGGNVWVFENNSFSGGPCHAIFVWQNDGNHHIIDGFVGTPSPSKINETGVGGGIDHGAYGNDYDYRNVTVPYVEVHAVGWVLSDSDVGEIILRKHAFAGTVTFTNTTATRILVADAPISNGQPITFTVNGTNLTCDDVDWANPHPETRVVIDGVECSRP